MKAELHALLSTDSSLLAVLTGGVHQASEISRQETPTAFDANNELLPCALLKMGTEVPVGPHIHSARTFFRIFLYARGAAPLETARRRLYAMLHRQRMGLSQDRCLEIAHQDDVFDIRDDALACDLVICRFAATLMKVVI